MDYDPLRPQARDKQRDDEQKKQENKRKLELSDLLYVMDSPSGRRLAHRMLEQAGVYTQSFNPDNPHLTAFNEGRRRQGLWLLAEIMEAAATQYALMIEEARNAD